MEYVVVVVGAAGAGAACDRANDFERPFPETGFGSAVTVADRAREAGTGSVDGVLLVDLPRAVAPVA